jgi:hypothetical protein
MRKLFLTLWVVLLLAVAASAQDVNAPIQQMLKGFNTGDLKLVAGSYASGGVVIVDEVAPHLWSGSDANATWLADLDKHDKALGVTDGKVTARPASRTEVNGDSAYVVLPVTYTYKEKDKPMAQDAHMVFVLHKEAGAWKIASWIWAGSKSHAAK